MKAMTQENIFDPPFAHIKTYMWKLQPKTSEKHQNCDFGVAQHEPKCTKIAQSQKFIFSSTQKNMKKKTKKFNHQKWF